MGEKSFSVEGDDMLQTSYCVQAVHEFRDLRVFMGFGGHPDAKVPSDFIKLHKGRLVRFTSEHTTIRDM